MRPFDVVILEKKLLADEWLEMEIVSIFSCI